jgi:mono/diheme cytochrome c family protein
VKCARTAGLALALALPAAAMSQDDRGRKVFTEIAQPSCALCHTLKAAGAEGTIGPSLDELKPDAAKVREAVTNGVGVMPPFAGKLSPADIEAVARCVQKAAGAN